jgi:hypothetical protein
MTGTRGKNPTQTARFHLKNVACNTPRDEYVRAFSKLPLRQNMAAISHMSKKFKTVQIFKFILQLVTTHILVWHRVVWHVTAELQRPDIKPSRHCPCRI